MERERELVELFSNAAHKHHKGDLVGLEPKTLFDHYGDESDKDAWTNPKEFH